MLWEKAKKFLFWLAERGLVITLLLALAVKIYLLFLRDYAIVNDGMLYVEIIRRICEQGVRGAFTNAYPFNPFPLFAALVHKLSGGLLPYEESALTVNFIFGLLALPPSYLLAKKYFGKLAALITGLYLALHPIFTEVSCQVLREATAVCFGLWAIYFLLTALDNEDPKQWSYGRIFLSFILALIGALIRIEFLALFLAGGAAILFSHAEKGKPYEALARWKRLGVCALLILVCLGLGFTTLRLIKGKWDFARFDQIFSNTALGEQKYSVEDPLKPAAEIYDANGQPIPLARTRYEFAHLAWDHQRALFGYEILYKTWKTLHPVGLVLFLLGLYFLFTKKPLKATAPLNIFTAVLIIIFSAVFYRYVSTKFSVSNRHIIMPVFVLSVYMGLFVNYIKDDNLFKKLLILALTITALTMLFYKVQRPLESHRLPLKKYGLQLKGQLPQGALMMAPDSLRQITYYAGLRQKMWAAQTGSEIVEQLSKKTNAFLLVNFKDTHAKVFKTVENEFEEILTLNPVNEKYHLTIYRLNKEKTDE